MIRLPKLMPMTLDQILWIKYGEKFLLTCYTRKGIVSNNSTSGFCRRGADVKTRLKKQGHIIKCFGESIAVSTKNAEEVII